MRADGVLSRTAAGFTRLSRTLARMMNDDPHPAVRAWSSRAAWNWWVWNPPIRGQLNQAFLRSLENQSLQLATGRVRFEDPARQQVWETALMETHVTGLGRAVHIARDDGIAWNVHLRPRQALDALGAAQEARLILAVFEAKLPDLQAIADQAIVTARLTHAELQVLAGLLKGLPAKAIAGKRNASVNTVRSQIMAILEKTGFRSQKELIASFGNSSFSPSLDSHDAHESDSHPPH
jgi:DNA-binding CsgD family transcriptional regulator